MPSYPRPAQPTRSAAISRLPARLSGCLLLTGFNLYVIITCAPILFRTAFQCGFWVGAVIATLFASLLGSLLRVWDRLVFRRRVQ